MQSVSSLVGTFVLVGFVGTLASFALSLAFKTLSKTANLIIMSATLGLLLALLSASANAEWTGYVDPLGPMALAVIGLGSAMAIDASNRSRASAPARS